MRLLISYILIILSTSFLQSQVLNQSQERILDSLENLVYKSSRTAIKYEYLLQKQQFWLTLESFDRAYFEGERITIDSILDYENRAGFLWNSALISNRLSNKEYAKFYYDEYLKLTKDSSMEAISLGLVVYSDLEYEEEFNDLLSKLNNDSLERKFSSLIELQKFELPAKKIRLASSFVLPGFAALSTGDIISSIGAVVITPSLVYLTYQLAERGMYVNALFVGLNIFPKFYIGNVRYTDDRLNRKEKKRKYLMLEKSIKDLEDHFNKYPLEFRSYR